MSHSHIRFHFPSGITEERCLQHTGWRVDEYTHSVAVGEGVPSTHYPLSSLAWFGFTSRAESCDEVDEDARLTVFIQETLGDSGQDQRPGRSPAPRPPCYPHHDARRAMTDYIITFAGEGIRDGYLKVTAADEEIVRAWAAREYGKCWSGIYLAKTFMAEKRTASRSASWARRRSTTTSADHVA